MRFFPFLLCIGLFLGFADPAHADNKQLARESYREGSRLYDLADWKNALESFRKAYFNYEEPGLLFNIAQCHRQLGNTTEALRFYRTFLRKVSNPPNEEEVKKLIAQLEATIEREKAVKAAPPAGTTGPDGTSSEPKHVTAPEPKPEPKPVIVEATPAASLTITQAPPPTKTPVYKKWWLWTIVGVVAVGAAVGIGLGLDAARPLQPTSPAVRF